LSPPRIGELDGRICAMETLKRWQFWLAVAISAALMYFSLRGLRLDEFGAALAGANYWWLIPGVVVYFIGVWVRSWRWHYLLRPVKKISTKDMFPVVAIGYFGNNVFPARAGEILRAIVLFCVPQPLRTGRADR